MTGETVKIAILNQKGGAGKTPVTINLAGALAALQFNVLVVDLDGQGDLTSGVGLGDDVYAHNGHSIYTLLTRFEGDLSKIVVPAPHDAFDVLPGNIKMYLAEKELLAVHNREMRLHRIFEEIDGVYDFVLVDCPPNLGIITDNALLGCKRVLVPARMNRKNTRAIFTLLDQIETIEDAFGVDIERIGIVPVAYQPDNDQKQLLAELHAGVSFVAPVLRKRETVIDDSWKTGRSVFTYVPSNEYRKKAQRETQNDYVKLAQYVMSRTKVHAL